MKIYLPDLDEIEAQELSRPIEQQNPNVLELVEWARRVWWSNHNRNRIGRRRPREPLTVLRNRIALPMQPNPPIAPSTGRKRQETGIEKEMK